jgi:hypothetical protein
MSPYHVVDPDTTGIRLPASFLDHLEAAAGRREILEIRDLAGHPVAVLPLFRLPAGAAPEAYGIATKAAPEDRILVATFRRPKGEPPAWALELVTGAWTYGNRGKDPAPVLAPPPTFKVTAELPLVRLELLAWAARLGVETVIRYDGDPDPRTLGDLRIVPQGPIRATDLAKAAPRTFTTPKITAVDGAAMTWAAETGYTRARGNTPPAWRA